MRANSCGVIARYAFDALPDRATPADLKHCTEELADAEREIARLSH